MTIFGRGSIGGRSGPSVTATDPLTIVTSLSAIMFFSGDLGVTLATGVSAWADQSGNGRDATQATGANQPALLTADADFGGRNSVSSDGINDFLNIVWAPVAPGTTNVWFFCVFLQRTWSAAFNIFAGGNAILNVRQDGTSPALRQRNLTAANDNTGAALGSPVRIEALFSNSTSDYLKVGGTSVTGTNAGNSAASSFRIFARPGSANSIDGKMACFGAWPGEPTSGEKAALDAWVTAYYRAGVGV